VIPSNKSSKSVVSIIAADGEVLRTEQVDSKDLEKVQSEFNIQADQLRVLGKVVEVTTKQRITG
jgi:hypothetical protein